MPANRLLASKEGPKPQTARPCMKHLLAKANNMQSKTQWRISIIGGSLMNGLYRARGRSLEQSSQVDGGARMPIRLQMQEDCHASRLRTV